jgi:hypothetical protein
MTGTSSGRISTACDTVKCAPSEWIAGRMLSACTATASGLSDEVAGSVGTATQNRFPVGYNLLARHGRARARGHTSNIRYEKRAGVVGDTWITGNITGACAGAGDITGAGTDTGTGTDTAGAGKRSTRAGTDKSGAGPLGAGAPDLCGAPSSAQLHRWGVLR